MSSERPPDDPFLQDHFVLLRRFTTLHVKQESDGRRVASSAFYDSPDGSPMSVVIREFLVAMNREAEAVLEGHSGFGLLSFQVGDARSLGLGITWEPVLIGTTGLAHALVHCTKRTKVRRGLQRAAEVLIWPS